VAKYENGIHTFNDVVTKTHAWNARKKHFSKRQIGIALDVLAAQGWIEPVAA
jgi:hypothetical protein